MSIQVQTYQQQYQINYQEKEVYVSHIKLVSKCSKLFVRFC